MEKHGLTSVTETGKKGGELWGVMTGDDKQVIRYGLFQGIIHLQMYN